MTDTGCCPSCGAPLVDGACAECERLRLTGLIQREAIVLASLIAITIAAFVLTRMAAAHDRASAERAAATWFDAGRQALAHGDGDRAIAGFRQAALNAPDTVRYQLSLAEALARTDQSTEARRILLRLRETEPETAEIALALARLAVGRGDVPEATRYYQHALYGVWNGSAIIEPAREQALRIELIRFLLDHRLDSQALSQTLLLAQHLPDDARAHREIGRLFLRAGSPSNALDHFVRVIALESADTAALAGAVEAAFALRDYGRAGSFLGRLRKAGDMPEGAADLAPVIDLILTGDPLAPRLSSADRARRLAAALDWALARASSCRPAPPELTRALGDARALRPLIRPAAIRRDRELTDGAFDLVLQLEELSRACGQAAPMDRALLLLGQKYANTPP
jgi:tetratricopeptide (TPR) repeat protein